MKRVFGIFEAVFDAAYLVTAFIISFFLFINPGSGSAGKAAGIMAIVLAAGDSFHLLPRMILIFTHDEDKMRPALGRGKQITSITMTIFYLLLWNIGLIIYKPENSFYWTLLLYVLAAVRILLCLLLQNKWQDRYPPVIWGIWRNIPFFLMGAATSLLFFINRELVPGLGLMWLAIILSFGFYFPVVVWSNRNAKIGMLMLPKTCAYVWMLVMCLNL